MTSKTDLWDFYRFLSSARRRQLNVVLLLMMVGAVAEMVTVGAIFPFLTALADPRAALDLPIIGKLLVAFDATTERRVVYACCIAFTVTALIALGVRLSLLRMSQALVFEVGHEMAQEVQSRVISQEYLFHISRNSSEMLASLEKVQVLTFNVLLQSMLGCIAAVTATFIVIILLIINVPAAIGCIAVLGGAYLAISLIMRSRLRRASATMARAYDRRIQVLQETLGGIRDIILDSSQRVFLSEFKRHDGDLQRARASSAFIGAAPRIVIEGSAIILVAVIAAVTASGGGELQTALPVLGAFALGGQRLLPLVQQVYLTWTNLVANRAVVGDVMGLLRLDVARPVLGKSASAPFTKEIHFDNTSFVYPTREQPALAHIDMVVPKGIRVGLIGTSGSGKSTLIDLLAGLLEPTSGEVRIDGRPLRGSFREDWQRHIAHVPQAIFLADTSITNNIAFGCSPEDVDHDRVADAAKIAQLHAFIATLPEGYDTLVGERGVCLSGGQRQRLGIARALYKNASVLILDEATSALDEQTEAKIIDALSGGQSRRTLIIISHRASTIRSCQLVMRIEDGRLVQTDAGNPVPKP